MSTEDILQRYMNLPKFVYLLQKKSLFLPKMSIFDDHLEGGLTAKDFLKNSNDPPKFDLIVNEIFPPGNENQQERNLRKERIKEISDYIQQRTFQTPFGNYKCEDIETIFPRCREWIYVSCWHNSNHECSAMWSLYGADKNSVCIFTTAKKLFEQIQAPESINSLTLEKVAYIDHRDASLTENCLSAFISKSLPFKFEKEMRIVAYDSSLDLSVAEKNNLLGSNISIKSLNELIDKIIISPKADDWFIESVHEICSEYGITANIQKSSLSQTRVSDFYDAMIKIQESRL